MDKTEKRLVKAHKDAVDRLAAATPGSVQSRRVNASVEAAWRALESYRASKRRGT